MTATQKILIASEFIIARIVLAAILGAILFYFWRKSLKGTTPPTSAGAGLQNFFVEFFTGDKPLWLTYWGGMLGNTLVTVIIFCLVLFVSGNYTLISCLFAVEIGWSAAVLVAIWKSARRYTGRFAWKILAQAVVVIGFMSLFNQIGKFVGFIPS